jgi:hypothetical protein
MRAISVWIFLIFASCHPILVAADDGCSSPNGCAAEEAMQDDEADRLKASLLQRTMGKAHSTDEGADGASLLARKTDILAELALIEKELEKTETEEDNHPLKPEKVDFLVPDPFYSPAATAVIQEEGKETRSDEGEQLDTAVARKELGANNCRNGKDQGIWNNGGAAVFGKVVGDCARAYGAEFHMTKKCMTWQGQGKGYTENCAACMSDYIQCNKNNCLWDCSTHQNDQKCNDCAVRKCNPPFNKCSGLGLR